MPTRKLVDQFTRHPNDITRGLGPAGMSSTFKNKIQWPFLFVTDKDIRILIKPEGKKNGKGPTPKSKKTT